MREVASAQVRLPMQQVLGPQLAHAEGKRVLEPTDLEALASKGLPMLQLCGEEGAEGHYKSAALPPELCRRRACVERSR